MNLLKAIGGVLAIAFFPLFIVGFVFQIADTAFEAGRDLADAIGEDE